MSAASSSLDRRGFLASSAAVGAATLLPAAARAGAEGGLRSIWRRQTRQRGGAKHLLFLPRGRQIPRLCLQPLLTLKAERGEQ